MAARTVGAMSITWWYWRRISPLAAIPLGQEMTAPLVMPPYPVQNWVSVNGVLSAIDQPIGGGHHRVRSTEVVEVGELVLERLGHLVERGEGVVVADPSAVAGGPVVAGDVHDQGVVEHAEVVDGLDDAADLVVGDVGERGHHLLVAAAHDLLVVAEVVPVGHDVGLRGEHGVGWDDAELLLAGQRLVADRVPAGVEAALVLVAPRGGNLHRRVGAGRGEVDEERLVRCPRLLRLDPGDGLVGDVGLVVEVRVVRRRHQRRVVVDARVEHVGLAADVAVEPFEAHPGRPTVERPARAGLERRGLVALAEHRRAVTVEPQHFGQRGRIGRQDTGLAGEAGGHLGDRAHVDAVAVAAGEQRHSCRRAARVHVEVGVGQPVGGEPLERRHRHRPAERGRRAIAEVVDQDHDHVRRTCRGGHVEARWRRCFADVELGDRRHRRRRDRQHAPVERPRVGFLCHALLLETAPAIMNGVAPGGITNSL